MKIPIKNLYYLLSYVWNVDWELDWSSLDAENSHDSVNLLTKILVVSTDRILRKGLDKTYVDVSEEIGGIRGRVDLASTIKTNGFSKSRLTCSFDDLSHAVLHNQIIKTTLLYLSKTDGLDRNLGEEVRDLLHRLNAIPAIKLLSGSFSTIRFHSNNRSYRLPLSVCEMLYEQLLPIQETGKYKFASLSDERLHRIFEKFVFNFYSKNLYRTPYCAVKKERLAWQDTKFLSGMDDLLPYMETDVSLVNPEERLVIECKFYGSAFQQRAIGESQTSGSFISAHLYQLFAYIENLQIKDGKRTSGLILYPENGRVIDSEYEIHGHRFLVKTVDLSMSPQSIHDQMIGNVARQKPAHCLESLS